MCFEMLSSSSSWNYKKKSVQIPPMYIFDEDVPYYVKMLQYLILHFELLQ